MKRTIVTLLYAFLFSVFLPSSTLAANFFEVHRDEDYLIYVDLDSIEDNGDYVIAWSKWIYRDEKARNLDVAHSIELTAYNKNVKQSQELSNTLYNSNGKSITSNSYQFSDDRYEYVIPDTLGELKYNFVIDYYQVTQDPEVNIEELWAYLRERGKEIASEHLKIDPKDFDEHNPVHLSAQSQAIVLGFRFLNEERKQTRKP